MAWAAGGNSGFRVDSQTQTLLEFTVKAYDVILYSEELKIRVRASPKTQWGPCSMIFGLQTQLVSLHIDLSRLRAIDREELVGRRIYRFAGVGLQGTLQPNPGPRAGHVHAIVLGFVQRISKLDENAIICDGRGVDRRKKRRRGIDCRGRRYRGSR